MLGISRKADYALVVLAELSGRPESPVSASHLADATRIPKALLRNILKDLARAGLLGAARGPFGGYAITRKPSSISVLEAIEAVEGRRGFTRCCGDAHETHVKCELAPRCRIRRTIRRLHEEIATVLQKATIADLVAEHEHGATEIPRPGNPDGPIPYEVPSASGMT